mmetsp:Transcript_7233/g.11412  ORF Transcript_7233/g.11412 Transcript_7233/m.11412 type:complete len:216 (-) Transcript_7233:104-751(-)|eukprot:CAMPEP_0194202510 /NCGR_PEP_ID=MMETSP0156-20130528/2512_1 /TAXON_ID=33649 /ORGANISM="Thalassionema nitzschioides, Strain L26-B" /LENGTH=215 /DNA_ID=CAMNT_0038928017 /DNA_START=48 /DNA_END=695 /DNA_ORIENTATION=-
MCESGLGCMCMPYKDPFLLAAQILTIIAMFISWGVWWSFLFFALPALVLIQLAWCMPLSKCGFITAGVLGTIASMMNIVAGIVLIVAYNSCTMYGTNCFTSGTEIAYTSFIAVAVLSFIGACLWLAGSVLVLMFAFNGRFERALAKCRGEECAAPSPGVVAQPVAAAASAKPGTKTTTKTITEMPDGTTKTVVTTINPDGSKTVTETISKGADNV